MKRILAGFFFFGCSFGLFAQSSECEQTLNQATEQFGAGHFYEIPALLKPCLERNDFTNEQRVRAYLLLCQVYLIVDDPIAAEDSYLKLLKADPEYIATKEKDPIDVVYLSKKFTSTPIFTPHGRIGLNASFVHALPQQDNLSSTLTSLHKGLRVGFQFGAGVDWNITDNVSLAAEGLFSTKGFKATYSKLFDHDNVVSVSKLFDFTVPVYVKYSVSQGKIRPFGYVGAAANFLLSAKDKIVLNNTTGNSTQSSQGPDVDRLYQRHVVNRSALLGGGVKYKIGKDFLFVDLRYMIGLNYMVKENFLSPKTDSSPNGYRHGTADDLSLYAVAVDRFKLDNLALSVGYIRPLYDPRKIKRRSVRNIFNVFSKKKE